MPFASRAMSSESCGVVGGLCLEARTGSVSRCAKTCGMRDTQDTKELQHILVDDFQS